MEDSTSGIQAAHSAGLAVVAIPNAAFPPSAEVLASADVVLDSIVELDRTLITSLGEQKKAEAAANERPDRFVGVLREVGRGRLRSVTGPRGAQGVVAAEGSDDGPGA